MIPRVPLVVRFAAVGVAVCATWLTARGAETDCASKAADGKARCSAPRLFQKRYQVCSSTLLIVGLAFEERCWQSLFGGPRPSLSEQELGSLLACYQANSSLSWGAAGTPSSTAPGYNYLCGQFDNTQKYSTEVRNYAFPVGYPYGIVSARRWVPAKCQPNTIPVGVDPEYPEYCVEPLANKCERTHNPMGIANGVRTISEVDLPARGSSTLEFARSYSSVGYYRPVEAWVAESAGFGEFWRHTYDRRVLLENSAHLLATLLRHDGSVKEFRPDGTAVINDDATFSKLTKLTDAQGALTGWRYQSGGEYEVYDASGKLVSTADSRGNKLTLLYSDAATPLSVAPAPGLLIRVTDNFGRNLAFEYDAASRLTRMTDADLRVYGYTFDDAGMLSRVTYPDNKTRQYLYNDNPASQQNIGTQGLTGILDEAGVRIATYGYGSVNGSFDYSERAGATQRIQRQSSGSSQSTVTDPLGTQRTYAYQVLGGVRRIVSQSQPAGAGCLATTSNQSYDAAGNVASRDDFNGYRTCFVNDTTRNLELTRVEGLATTSACSSVTPAASSLPAGARKVSTQWHPDWTLEARRAEPRKLTTHVYNGRPDPFNSNAIAACAPVNALLPDGKPLPVLCKTVERPTTDLNGGLAFSATLTGTARTTTATYNLHGQVLTRTDARGFVTSYAYYDTTTPDYTQGDLATVTNPAGHVTRFTRYDKAGRVLRSVEPNGVVTDTAYHNRGWVSSVTVTPTSGTPQITAYDYWPTGKLREVTTPDGVTLRYAYDDAQRLVGVTDGAGNTVTYTLDGAGNRISEQYKDAGGNLARSIQRVYDSLNRLQFAAGAPQ